MRGLSRVGRIGRFVWRISACPQAMAMRFVFVSFVALPAR
jgi:hypothetical protein